MNPTLLLLFLLLHNN